MATEILRPDGDTYNQSDKWHCSTGSDLYALIDEVTADDNDYVYDDDALTPQGGYRFRCSLSAPVNVSDGDTINSIRVYWRGRSVNGAADAIPFLYNGSNVDGTKVVDLGTSFVTRNEIIGSGWEYADLASLEVGVNYDGGDGKNGQIEISQLYVEIDYTAGSGPSIRLANSFVPDKFDTDRIGHLISQAFCRDIRFTHGQSDFDKEFTQRLHQSLNLRLVGYTKRLGNFVDFESYDAPWWDADYYKRRLISFGSSHDNLKKGYTAQFEMMTGYEEKIPGGDNCAVNEGCHQIVYYNGYYYISWLALNYPGDVYRVYITRRNKDTGVWDTPVNVIAAPTAFDSHYAASLFIDSDGYIHLLYGAHHSDIKYIRSTNAEDITAWTAQDDIGYDWGGYTATFSYPGMIEDSSGNLYIFTRVGGGEAGSLAPEYYCYFKSTDGGDTWGNLKQVIDYSDNYYGRGSCYASVKYVNSTFHLTITWHDNYGQDSQCPRAISYLYSTNGTSWYEKETGYVGDTYDWQPGVQHMFPIEYDECSKIWNSSDGEWSMPASEENMDADPNYFCIGLTVDTSNNPYLLALDNWQSHTDCGLHFAKWTGSAWSKTEISSGGVELAHDRLGGGLILDGTNLYVFLFAQPESSEERFGMELYRYKGTNYGASWTGKYLSKNTAFGAPLLYVLDPVVYDVSEGVHAICVYGRCDIGYFRINNFYPYTLPDGDDIRIIRTDLINGSYVHTEVDRLPGDRFRAEDTIIEFGTLEAISPNNPYPSAHSRYWEYHNEPYESTEAANDHSNIYPFYDGFETITSNAQLNTSSNWSGDNDFLVIAAYDRDVWNQSHTNKLWDGDKFAVLLNQTTACNIRTAHNLNKHEITIRMWLDTPKDYGYVELYDSSSSKYIRIGFAENKKCVYKKSGGSYTEVGDVKVAGQYYLCKFIINENGVSASIGDEVLLTNDNHMISATHFGMGCESTATGGIWCWDALYIKHWVSNPPEVTLGTEEGEDNWGVERIAHSAALRFHRELRIDNSLTPVKYGAIRLMGDTNLDKVEIERICNIIIGDKELSGRISNAIDVRYSDLIRKCNGSILDKEDIIRKVNNSDLRKSDKLRLMGDTNLDKVEIERITQGLLSQKHTVTRMHNKGDVSRMDILRMMSSLGLQKHEAERLCEIVVGDKEDILRSGQDISGNKVARFRIGGMVSMDKHVIDQMAAGIELDKEITERIHNETDLIFTRVIRMMEFVVGDKEITSRIHDDLDLRYSDLIRIKNDLIEQKHEFVRLASESIPDKVSINKLMSDISARYSDAIRIAEWMETEKEQVTRIKHISDVWNYESVGISNLVSGDKEEALRLMDDVVLSKVERLRIGHGSISDKEEFVRVYNEVTSDKELILRMMSTFGLDKEEVLRRADNLGLDKEELLFLCNISIIDKADVLRISNSSNLHYLNVIRIIHTIAADKEQTYRISHKPDLSPEDFIRLHQSFDLDKGEFTRNPSEVVVDKFTTERLMEWLSLNKELSDRIAEGLNLDKENYEEIANEILTNKQIAIRLGSLPDVNKTLTYRVANDMDMDAYQTSRLHHWTYLEVSTILELANDLGLDKEDRSRLGNIIDFMDMESKRIHHSSFGRKISTTRFPEIVPLIKFVTSRISNTTDTDKGLVERINQSLVLDLMSTAREANLIVGNKVVRERINNSMSLHFSDMVQFASSMDLYKFTSGRIANSLAFYSVVIEGAHIEECVVVPFSITDLNVETLKMTNKVIETLKITDREVQTNKVIDRIVETLKADERKVR